MNTLLKKIFLFSALPALIGCTGIDIPPHIFKGPPYTLLRGSEQIGRDQIANRLLVADSHIKIQGLITNDVLTLLGQPQEIQIVEREVSEDWIYVYYKKYTPKSHSEPSEFMVRFYHDKVIDVVKDV